MHVSLRDYARRGVASIACRGKSTTKPLKILVRLPQEDDVDAISDVVLSCPYLDEAMLVMYSSCE